VDQATERELGTLYEALPREVKARLDQAVQTICQTKREGGKVCVLTGSGPNLHEGVTTLIAELIRVGVVDGVLTSSAVVAHEMAGCLERVHRVKGTELGLDPKLLPADGRFEVSLLANTALEEIEREIAVDRALIERALNLPGETIIKAAGNMAYPLGLRTEILSEEISRLARSRGETFEEVAGGGCDPRTMIGAGFQNKVPVLVTVPQLIGGGRVGIGIGESTPIGQRSGRIARLLESCDVIIESAVALAQEVHDGPFETFTGHGIWSGWRGEHTFRLEKKNIIRIDLDPHLELAWKKEKESGDVRRAIAEGLPKTKATGIPFRMEMSGFARLPGSLPIIGDIGRIWPVMAQRVAEGLGLDLRFISFPQETERGKTMREWIVSEIEILKKDRMIQSLSDEQVPPS